MWEETGFNFYSDKVLAIIPSLWLQDSNMRHKAWITYQHQTKAMVVVVKDPTNIEKNDIDDIGFRGRLLCDGTSFRNYRKKHWTWNMDM